MAARWKIKFFNIGSMQVAGRQVPALRHGIKDDEVVGFFMFSGYTSNDRALISLRTVDPGIDVGEELALV
jgi:vanillate/3-O-methylgallate O-demethylase